ncbi:MAG: tetratricopeptide repeat protein [Deltaproteobacteria bacterium]|nr:tetratricopeptide repeat protein [Deltaproteobacteria bacterium]
MGATPPPLAGKLVYFQGQVEVSRGGLKDWTPAQINQDLFAGDTVKTGAISRAAILCVDESQLKLNENTLITLKSATPSPRLRLGEVAPAALKEAAPSLYEVPQGEIWLRNKNEKFLFDVETPAVTAAIRGTEFNLRVAADGATSLVLLEGSLRLFNSLGELLLKPGEEGLARPGQAPAKRVLVQPADAVQWSLYYPGIISYRDLPLSASGERPRPPGPSAAAVAVVQGESLYDQGRLEQAQQEAEAALKLEPQNDQALTLLGWICLQTHALDKAEGYFRRVRQADDRAVIGLALARYRLGDVTGAYALMQAARAKLKPTPLLATMTGYFYLLAGRVEEARSLLEAAVQQAPAMALPRALLSQIYLVQNRKAAARNAAAQALAQNPASPVAQLTMGLVNISYFDLPAAKQHLEKALSLDPRFVDAYVYLAKIWLGSDYLDRAWKTIGAALRLAPQDGEVLTLAGFIRLGYRDYSQAFLLFSRAVRNHPALGEPHLGLGIYHFRHRDFDQGLASMLTATLLDPRVSLYQTSLGKALYQVRSFDMALEVYDYAKTLDPKDPSPYLYKGIALTDLNRPGEAIEEINRSIALNDNNAIFRSRIMLDRDLAVRNYNLARSFAQLGLGDWAYSKAVTAVKNDPTNSSAQLFLANAFAATRQRLGSAGSSLLLYRLLSPANQNTFTVFNDYTPMFEMPYIRLQAQGGIGTWGGGKAIQEHSVELYGGLPGLAFDVFGSYQDDRGFRVRNGDSTTYIPIGFAKWEPTVKDSLFAGFSYADREAGDTSNLNDYGYQNLPSFRQFFHSRQYEVGYAHRFSPASTFLAYFTYMPTENHSFNRTISTFDFFGFPITLDDQFQRRADRELLNVQLQKQLILGDHTFIGGFDYLSGHLKYRTNEMLLFSFLGIPLLTAEINNDFKPPDRSYSFYLLDYWRLFPNLLLELGVFKDYSKNSRVGYGAPLSTSLWSPRFGVNYQINSQHTLRLALQQHLSTHNLIQPNSLIPVEVASFPWAINVDDGAIVREAGFAWEAQWNSKTFSTLRLNHHRFSVPQYEVDQTLAENRVWWTWKRYLASFTVNRILTPYLGLTLGGSAKRFVPDPNPILLPLAQDFNEYFGLLGLAFLHRSGWQGGINAYLVDQHLKDRDDNFFGLVDARIGYEFPQKRGLAQLEVSNIFNRHFFFQREFVTFDAFFPVRRIMFKFALYF